jgi:hypothetical protein
VRRPALPTVDLAAFTHVARRTSLVRAVLVLGLVGAVGAGALAARQPEVETAGLLRPGSSGVVVLDASASVEGTSRIAEVLPELYVNPNRRIRAVLRTLVERDDPVGLVLFSDVGYELLPPETPGRVLAPLLRFFNPVAETQPTAEPGPFLLNPWTNSFSGGTLISAGIFQALEMIDRDGIENASILLLSDLDAPDDPQLESVLRRVRDSGVTLRVVSLSDDRSREQRFTRILGDDVFIDAGRLERSLPSAVAGASIDHGPRHASPMPLILAGALVLLLLGVHERVLVRLPIPRRDAR